MAQESCRHDRGVTVGLGAGKREHPLRAGRASFVGRGHWRGDSGCPNHRWGAGQDGVVTIVIVMRLAEQSESYISWAIFAALLVSGATTILQASKIGRTAWRT